MGRLLLLASLAALLCACSKREPASEDLYQEVDQLFEIVVRGTDGFELITQVDHSRLAAKEGEVMPPARAIIFSDPGINTSILQQEPMAGLDLPFRVLSYAEGDTAGVLFTPAEFLKRRHDLEDGPALLRYETALDGVMAGVPVEQIVAWNSFSLGEGQGIIALKSNYDFDQTIQRLKDAIMAEGDTIWFGDIDYREEAAELGVDLPNLTLLLFGAPGPGAKAMAEYPRMGLDAFCQKVLVYQPPGGQVSVLFNDMTAFAELHNGSSALPHKVISRRMRATLSGAVED